MSYPLVLVKLKLLYTPKDFFPTKLFYPFKLFKIIFNFQYIFSEIQQN